MNSQSSALERCSTVSTLSPAQRYVHCTSHGDAIEIVAAKSLQLSGTICGSVYATAVGGSDVPGVQQGAGSTRGFGRVVGERTHAVVFSTESFPDVIYPEEVIWRRTDAMPIGDCVIVTRDEARRLLDGSLGIIDTLLGA